MDQIRPHFLDHTLDARLVKDGFVEIPQLLDKYEVRELVREYDRYHTDRSGSQATLWNSSNDIPTEAGKALSTKILQFAKPRLQKILAGFDAPLAQIISKNHGDSSDVHLHRDTTIFDEDQYTYLNVWIPLVDTDEKTGGMFFLPGSHRLFRYPRLHVFNWHYNYLRDSLMPYVQSLKGKAGDCVVFTDRVLHGSWPNQAGAFRPVAFLGLVHPQAQIRYYYYDAQINEVRIYDVPDDFYFRRDFTEPKNKYPMVGRFSYQPDAYTAADVITQLKDWQVIS
jgi:ectoine hydroxylase-related dioxygenase (phytanoyl-CoA dioxygenase family)